VSGAETVARQAGEAEDVRLSHLQRFEVFGVPIVDSTMGETLALVEDLIERPDGRSRAICFVNAHTLNLAWADPELTAALREAEYVFGDGTGVRWAVRHLHGQRLRDNVNGSDFVPWLLSSFAGRGYRYYFLGGQQDMLDRAADHARRLFPHWQLAGSHHGYVDPQASEAVLADIDACRPQVLLVGMGNPVQERWIRANLPRLKVPVCIAVGGLMAYWSGDLTRAPAWLRKIGFEWVHLMIRQPRKLRRYLLGNPAFLTRILRARRPSSVGTPPRGA
jgi:N-acetylglucosaminyldiphosphoundecaprenol N-acetyl-beta-D-mannosaminyltransferase